MYSFLNLTGRNPEKIQQSRLFQEFYRILLLYHHHLSISDDNIALKMTQINPYEDAKELINEAAEP